jgi:H+/Cl- antiporter ClcA
MQMPLTAVVLILEFTRVSHDFLIPVLLAVAGSVSTFRLLASGKLVFWRNPVESAIPVKVGPAAIAESAGD